MQTLLSKINELWDRGPAGKLLVLVGLWITLSIISYPFNRSADRPEHATGPASSTENREPERSEATITEPAESEESGAGEEAASPVPPTSTPQRPVVDDNNEPTPTRTARATTTPKPTKVALVGTASCSDSSDDVRDLDGGLPPYANPGLDIKEVTLTSDGDMLRITFTSDGPIPDDSTALGSPFDSYNWTAELQSGEDAFYFVGANLIGANWYASVFDFGATKSVDIQQPSASGNSLVLTVPLTRLPKLEAPITWNASAEWGDSMTYADKCPDDGTELQFPGP